MTQHLISLWNELYSDNRPPSSYAGDYNDGIHKLPFNCQHYGRWLNNQLKFTAIFNFLLNKNFIDFPNIKILDIGCGNGHDLRTFCEVGACPSHCYGIDFSQLAINYCIDNSPTTLNFLCADFLTTPLPLNYFNLILLFNTFSNITDNSLITTFLTKINQIKTSDGLLLLILGLSEEPQSHTKATTPHETTMPQRFYSLSEIKEFFSGFQLLYSSPCSTGNMRTQKHLFIYQ